MLYWAKKKFSRVVTLARNCHCQRYLQMEIVGLLNWYHFSIRNQCLDDERCGWSDLSSQFYASEEDVVGKGVGKTRAEVCVGKLQELNPAVEVRAISRARVDADVVAAHEVVVCTETSEKEAAMVNAMCRAKGVAFIKADVRGVFGSERMMF